VRTHRRRRGRAGDGALILLYHRVADTVDDPLGMCVSPPAFAEQLDVLAATRRIVTLEELAAQREPGTVAITFDDGYRDNATTAAPALAARGLPWTLFASTGHLDERRAFWWDEVTRAFAGAHPKSRAELRLALPGGPRAWRVATPSTRVRARDALLVALHGLDAYTIAAAVDGTREWAGPDAPPGPPLPMTVSELCELARSGVAIGAHSRTHRSLAFVTADEQRADIGRSREDLERWLGRPPTAFAYPFGVPGADVDASAMRIVRELGFACAVVNAPGLIGSRSDAFALSRAAVPGLSGEAFARWLHRHAG
jgi:peptidoglycan/xylan/chitin deacetylase (PgdA/CDA1 family)